MIILALIAVALALGFCYWWLIIETEGVYLGKRVVVALYDRYAPRYDRVKQFDERADLALIAQPIMARVQPQSDPLILDLATGTGRLPLIMARDASFCGHVIGLDASRRMLQAARRKVDAERFDEFITLIQGDASERFFPGDCFDVVTCLEALEFMPDPERVLFEMVRVLQPGGLLLTTIRIDTRWMPNRTWSETKMRRTLESLDMGEISIEIWQDDYSQVWARKAGASPTLDAEYLPAARPPGS
ncbi:MAG: methyltransferase domain-containing protein [Chloroflexi bacterium]|nr:methyltransferase domain-containing protein [Chloroflexota bacterium]